MRSRWSGLKSSLIRDIVPATVSAVPRGLPSNPVPPTDGHRWISIIDDDNDTWLFDATFMLSSYNCIYGDGCQSIDTEVDHTEVLGCCVHGAHFVDDEDLQEVVAASALLTPDQWQFHGRAAKKGGPFKQNSDGDWVTKKAQGACIFLNRSDFPGGGGCALHRAALERNERPLDWKPDVCWQVPIRLDIHTDDNGFDTVFVRAWERKDWGEGGAEFNWWCIESAEAYQAVDPVYVSCRDELVEMVGEGIYDRLVPELEEIAASGSRPTPVTLTTR